MAPKAANIILEVVKSLIKKTFFLLYTAEWDQW